jgi:hypothetical protein
MVAAWLKIAIQEVKAPPTPKKQRPHRQNVFSKHQNASAADVLTGLRNFARGSIDNWKRGGSAVAASPASETQSAP